MMQVLGCDLEAEAGNRRIYSAAASRHIQHQGADAATAAAWLDQRRNPASRRLWEQASASLAHVLEAGQLESVSHRNGSQADQHSRRDAAGMPYAF